MAYREAVTLQSDLLDERLRSYTRLRGGYPIALAGALWWLALAAAGYAGVPQGVWIFGAAVASGLLFPLALGLSKLLGCDFMNERTAVTDVLFPAFTSMLLFWPMAISAWWSYPPLFPLILGIGMSLHWPVIGWGYGKTVIYSAHAVSRAVICFVIWNWLPWGRFTLLPLSVAAVYMATVLVILWDTRARTSRLPV